MTRHLTMVTELATLTAMWFAIFAWAEFAHIVWGLS